jgi:hypothetical protein
MKKFEVLANRTQRRKLSDPPVTPITKIIFGEELTILMFPGGEFMILCSDAICNQPMDSSTAYQLIELGVLSEEEAHAIDDTQEYRRCKETKDTLERQLYDVTQTLTKFTD